MVIDDAIYGRAKITSRCILELIDSPSLQRLKGIAQFGIPDEFYHIKNFSRYDHSVGVMLLLNRLGASEEEQIAGLLHDVSHTAFSHTIDWVVGDGKTEDYQDEHHDEFIANSELPRILKKNGFDPARITDYHHFGLLERDLPELCADRIDYSLREFPEEIAKQCFENLTEKDNKIVFKNKTSAHLFATNFLKQQRDHWGSLEGSSRYRLFADALRLALKDKTITKDDFWQDDQFVVDKLKTYQNPSLQKILTMLRKKSLTHLSTKNGIRVYKKFRHVDPVFIQGTQLLRLSKTDEHFAQELEAARTFNKKGNLVPQL